MKIFKYFIEFIFISFFFFLSIILGYKYASNFGSFIISTVGPFFRPKKIVSNNLKNVFEEISEKELVILLKSMWSNYGRILSDYMHLKNFRNLKLSQYLKINGNEILEDIKKEKEPVIFISGHFNNFELMAMQIEKAGIDVAAIYRPLNNIFLDRIMLFIRKKYICKNQIKKGLSGTREILRMFKKKISIALMIDQRVSEGIKVNFFKKPALTTTIPAQFVKKFKCKIVPIYIERKNNIYYEITINKPLKFNENDSIEKITQDLNFYLEKLILKNPSQWIWSHNRWK